MQDDDSDLECELEACPPVINEAAIEASNCVKVRFNINAFGRQLCCIIL